MWVRLPRPRAHRRVELLWHWPPMGGVSVVTVIGGAGTVTPHHPGSPPLDCLSVVYGHAPGGGLSRDNDHSVMFTEPLQAIRHGHNP